MKKLFASERKIYMDELRQIQNGFQSNVVAQAKEVYQSMSDEVGYLCKTRFDMLETLLKNSSTRNEFDYYWRRFATSMSEGNT